MEFVGDTHLAICPGDCFLCVGWEERSLGVEGEESRGSTCRQAPERTASTPLMVAGRMLSAWPRLLHRNR